MSNKKAIVIGASSGIGLEVAQVLAERGWTVAALARREDQLEVLANRFPGQVIPIWHDVTNTDSVPILFQETTHRIAGLDAIFYCAGVMHQVGADEFDYSKDKQMMEVNLLGAMAWLNEAAVRFAGVHGGSIVAISSVAGDRGRGKQPGYNASKAGLNSYLESLRNRLCSLGVKVVTIKPGPTATEMTAHLSQRGMASARSVAEFAVGKMDRSGEHYGKFSHRVLFYIIKRIPSPIFRRMRMLQ